MTNAGRMFFGCRLIAARPIARRPLLKNLEIVVVAGCSIVCRSRSDVSTHD